MPAAGRGKGKGKGRGGGKGRGKGSTVQSIYQRATAFLSPLQQDVICGLRKEDIVVVPGGADRIEVVLQSLNIEFQEVQGCDLRNAALSPRQAVFINCCSSCDEEGARAVERHVHSGGVVVTTDHEVQHVLERAFPGVVNHVPLPGDHDACLGEVDPTHCLSCAFPQGANWHIDGGAYGVKICDSSKCRVLIKSPDVDQGVVMLEIPHGRGRAVHLISHFEQVSRHMKHTSSEVTPAEIAELSRRTGVHLADDDASLILESKLDVRQLQTAVAGITMLVNVLVLARLGSQPSELIVKPPAQPSEGGNAQLSPQEALFGLAQSPVTLHSDVSADGRVQELRELVAACAGAGDVLFPMKVAAWLRRGGGHRETATCLAAMAALDKRCAGCTSLALQQVLREPGSLVRVAEWTRVLNGGARNLPSGMKKGIRLGFARMVNLENLSRIHRSTHEGLKMLIRQCHITEPPAVVEALLGKRYPYTESEWVESFGPERPVDHDLLGAKRKIVRDQGSVAVKLSKAGQDGQSAKEQAWEEMLLQGSLPGKDVARNLRNILDAKLSPAASEALLKQLRARQFAAHVSVQQAYVAWRATDDAQVREALEAALDAKPREGELRARRVLVLLDVSPSMSRPTGAGTASASCKEAAALLAGSLRKAWQAEPGKKEWFRICTFPAEEPGTVGILDADHDKQVFQLAAEAESRSVWPNDAQGVLPWAWLRSDECGEAEDVIVITDADFVPHPEWTALVPAHHAKARKWWQIRCVNVRGSPGQGAGAEARGHLVNGCDEAVVRRLLAAPQDIMRSVRDLVFEPVPKEAAYAAVVMLRTQAPRLGRHVLRHILGFAAPVSHAERRHEHGRAP